MKRITAALLAVLLLISLTAFAESASVADYVSRAGFKAISSKNRSRITGCWLTEDDAGDTLQWADSKNTYTVTTKPGRGLRSLYGDLIAMADWDSCSYTFGDRVQFAYNAPDVQAVKTYKTLSNYVRYVSAYIAQTGDEPTVQSATGRQKYILNTRTGKFHLPDCPDVKQMKASNKEKYTGTREELLDLGYDPCKHCNP